MRWHEYLRVALRLGLTAAELVREARRRGDHRPAREILGEVQSRRAAERGAHEAEERLRRVTVPVIPTDPEVESRVEAMAREAEERMRRRDDDTTR